MSYAKGYEGDGPLPNERVLWRLDPTTASPQLQVLSTVRVGALDQLAAHGQYAYLADAQMLRSMARDGALIGVPAAGGTDQPGRLGPRRFHRGWLRAYRPEGTFWKSSEAGELLMLLNQTPR